MITLAVFGAGLLALGIAIQIKARQERRVDQERIDEIRNHWKLT